MNPYLLILQKKLGIIVLFIVLFLWALTSSILAVKNETEIIIIGIDDNGTRIVNSINDPLFRSEIVNFLKSFSYSMYNFSPDTFSDNVGSSVEHFSLDLWEQKKSQFRSLQERVSKENINLKSELVKIVEVTEGTFSIELESQEKSKILNRKRNVIVNLKLRRVERTKTNAWGLEVIELHETFTNI